MSHVSDLIVNGANTLFVPINEKVGKEAAQLRAQYNISLVDALQIAVALDAGCEGFLTNDNQLKRVQEIQILVLEELELASNSES